MRLERRNGEYVATQRRGGYGHLFGDPGSGYHLGLESIRAAAEHADRGGISVLGSRLAAIFEVNSIEEVAAKAVSATLSFDLVIAEYSTTCHQLWITSHHQMIESCG